MTHTLQSSLRSPRRPEPKKTFTPPRQGAALRRDALPTEMRGSRSPMTHARTQGVHRTAMASHWRTVTRRSNGPPHDQALVGLYGQADGPETVMSDWK